MRNDRSTAICRYCIGSAWTLVWTALPLALGCGMVSATDLGDAAKPARPPTFMAIDPDIWVVTMSATLQGVPRYPGAADAAVVGYPGIDVHRLGEPHRFSAPDDNFSVSLYDGGRIRLGPTARYVSGRYYGDDRRHLFGFRDARYALEPGVFAELYPVPAIRLRGEVRHGVLGHHGTVGSLGADYILPSDGWEFSIGPRLNVGDAGFARKYFGVAPFEAALNDRVTPFAPSSYVAAGVLGAATYTPNATWAYTAYVGYDRILGQAARSPLVRRPFGSPDQITVGLKVGYAFTTPAPF